MRRLPIAALLAITLVTVPAATLPAQPPQRIGPIRGGTVFLEPKSVQRKDGIIAAALRVQFDKPSKVPGGTWYGSRTLLRLDCRKQLIAVTENWYYSDAKGTQVAQHKVVGIPGYGTPLPGSMGRVALDHLCSTR